MKRALLAAAFVLSIAGASMAAEVGKYEVGGGPSYAIPIGGSDGGWSDTVGGSFGLNAYGAYQFHELLSAGLELGYGFGHKGKDYMPEDFKIKMLQITPFIKASKAFDMGGKKANYYGILGAGLYHWSYAGVPGWGALAEDNSGSNFGFNIGGGVMVEVAPQWEVGLDLRWVHVFSVKFAEGDEEGVSINNITPMLKVAYTF